MICTSESSEASSTRSPSSDDKVITSGAGLSGRRRGRGGEMDERLKFVDRESTKEERGVPDRRLRVIAICLAVCLRSANKPCATLLMWSLSSIVAAEPCNAG